MFWKAQVPSESDTMPYSAASVANGFLQRSFRDRKPISPMKIQKLVYIANGCTLVECGEPLLDEVFEAWKFGPVLNSLYHECKHYGHQGIKSYLRDSDFGAWFDSEGTEFQFAPLPTHPDVVDILDFVWSEFGHRAPMELSAWTHQKNGPWHRVTNGGTKVVRHQIVPNQFIEDFFLEYLYE